MSISIIEFSVENFGIFKNKVSFSMLARKSEHSFEKNGQELLRTSLIYGPNASGKTTLFNAIRILRNETRNSTGNKDAQDLPYNPFKLLEGSDKPSFFEIIFLLDEKKLKYSFSISSKEVLTENLSEILSSEKESVCFLRTGQKIELFDYFLDAEDIKKKTREEVLFLSAAFEWNNELAKKIITEFKNINVISGPESDGYRQYTMKLFKENPDKKKKILEFLKKADFCIVDGEAEKIQLPEEIKRQISLKVKDVPGEIDTVNFFHVKYNSKKEKRGVEKFNINDESAGTQRFFYELGPIIDTLEDGKVLFIDEFDNSLHPFLTKFIIDLFEKNNPNNAQLVVTTHDTSLLSYKEFIKDQFWFTEKDEFGSGNLFSLSEFDLRNDTEYSKKYLEGRFGGLPFVELVK